MEKLTLIIAQQEYCSSNHKFLWHELSKDQNSDVVVLDIPADKLITRILKKKYRIDDHKNGMYKVENNLNKYRPLYKIRPEIMPDYFLHLFGKSLRKQLSKYFDLNTKDISFIIYDAIWAEILKGFGNEHKIYYYIYDEYCLHAHNDKNNKKKMKYEKLACEKAEHIFTMTEAIKKRRGKYENKITVIGNGASLSSTTSTKCDKIQKSVAFIGTFRDWIDTELLEQLIKVRQDINFCFVGSIEKNMYDYFNYLMNNYKNTIYFGVLKKEIANDIYKKFNVVIVPYKQNEFMQSTRPIKIVESIFSGTPVVTIPINGYEESKYIRFAEDFKGFSDSIDYFLLNEINTYDSEYENFISDNSWKTKAEIINNIIQMTGRVKQER